jgi:hypothetical protein
MPTSNRRPWLILGICCMSLLIVAITGSLVAGTSDTGLASASHGAWVLLAACGLAVAVLGYASTGRRARVTAQRVSGMLDDADTLGPHWPVPVVPESEEWSHGAEREG